MQKAKISDINQNPPDFELFFRISIDAMIISDFEGNIIDFNEAYEKLTGYSRAELFEKNGGWDLILPEDIPDLMAAIGKLIDKTLEMTNYQFRIRNKEGAIRTVSYDTKADFIRGQLYGIGRDITAEKEKEASLINSEARLSFFFDNVLDGMCVMIDGKYSIVNKAFLKIIGYSDPNEVIGKDYLLFVDDAYKDKVKRIVDRDSDERYTSVVRRKDGVIRNIEVTGKSIWLDNRKIRVSVVRDLDEQLQLQQKLIESESRFKAIFQNNLMGIILTTTDGAILEINQSLLDQIGKTKEELQGTNLIDIIYEDDRPSALVNLGRLLANEVELAFAERRLVNKDNKPIWSKMTCSLVLNDNGERLVLGIIENVQSIKENEQALFESEIKFKAVYKSSPMGIIISKKPGIIVDVNPIFAEMMGYEVDELIGKNLVNITHPNDVPSSLELMEKIYSKAISQYTNEKIYLRKDGSSFWAKGVVSLINEVDDEVFTVAIVENIEKKKLTERTLEQKNIELLQINQELEHFAYVASHDLQEPLRTITSFIQILDRKYATQFGEDAQQFMSFVVDGAKRMQMLIHDLLEYSRINRHNTGYEKVDLNEIFNTVSRVLKDKIESNDALVLAENLPMVYGNRIQLTQVFQNLVDNAIKFKAPKRKPEILISVLDLKDKWELIFRDNGIGISQEYFQRIFIIFQRLHTLEEYSGTGIGLAICKKIIERHGGEIWVESKAGKGTAFHLTISKQLMKKMPSLQ